MAQPTGYDDELGSVKRGRDAIVRVQLAQQSAFRDPNQFDSGRSFSLDGSAAISILRNLVQSNPRVGNRLFRSDAWGRQCPARSRVGLASGVRFVDATFYD